MVTLVWGGGGVTPLLLRCTVLLIFPCPPSSSRTVHRQTRAHPGEPHLPETSLVQGTAISSRPAEASEAVSPTQGQSGGGQRVTGDSTWTNHRPGLHSFGACRAVLAMHGCHVVRGGGVAQLPGGVFDRCSLGTLCYTSGGTTTLPLWRDHHFATLAGPPLCHFGGTTTLPLWRDHHFATLAGPPLCHFGETTTLPLWRDHHFATPVGPQLRRRDNHFGRTVPLIEMGFFHKGWLDTLWCGRSSKNTGWVLCPFTGVQCHLLCATCSSMPFVCMMGGVATLPVLTLFICSHPLIHRRLSGALHQV